MEGWVQMHRSMATGSLWLSEPFTRGQAWVDLIMLANHADGFIRVRGVKQQVKRGQVAWSEVKLAERWQWSRGKVRRFISELKTVQQIAQQNNNVSTLITITNYDTYQSTSTASSTASSTADGHQTDSRRYPNKNDNKENNGKNDKKVDASKRRPNSREEIVEFVKDLKLPESDGMWLFDKWEGNGYKNNNKSMNCWRSTARAWVRGGFFPSQKVNGRPAPQHKEFTQI